MSVTEPPESPVKRVDVDHDTDRDAPPRSDQPQDARRSLDQAQTAAQGAIIAFTGGGSAGHVTPNLALIDAWQRQGGEAIYLGRAESVESQLLADVDRVPFIKIPSERLRRYFHWGNFIMPFIVIWGTLRAALALRKHRPQLLFSKGGFVALPVVIGAWLNRIPVIIHESDGSLGLANRLSLPFTRVVCVAQQRAMRAVKHRDVRVTGAPLRRDFLEPQPERAGQLFNLEGARPLLVIFGGSQGAQRINEAVWSALERLLSIYEVLHVVGPDKRVTDYDQEYRDLGYHQHEYITEGFADLLARAHLVVGRAGANAIAELITLHKPALLIPLSSKSSRGDQALNAAEFVELGGGLTLDNDQLTSDKLCQALEQLEADHSTYTSSLSALPLGAASARLTQIFTEIRIKS